jgi:hypothetical protein
MRPRVVAAAFITAAVAGGVFLVLRFGPSGSAAGERGLVLHLPLRDDLRDHSPFAHPITVAGQVRLEAGGARFGGEGSWLAAPHIPLAGKPFAIALWVKPLEPDGAYGLFQQHDQAGDHHLFLMLAGDRPVLGSLGGAKLIRPGAWNHLVFAYTGYSIEIWVNGARTRRHSTNELYQGQRGDTFIGRHPRLSHRPATDLEGWLADVRIYQGAFESDRILALHRRGSPR